MAPSIGVRLVSFFLTATPTHEQKVSFSVCLSPGCVADGALKTLDKLTALAPANVDVMPGTCESLCGNGPVVVTNSPDDKKVIHRRITGDALLELLTSDAEHAIDSSLLKGYDLVAQAQDLFENKKYEQAIPLYEDGIEMALKPAKALVDDADEAVPKRLEWLIRAYRDQAQACLEVGEKERALHSAKAACDLSNNAHAPSLDVLATVCQACNDAVGELEALQAMFSLPEDPNMTREVANRRRTLGFRLAKLEREAS